jgi:hypothetical protein
MPLSEDFLMGYASTHAPQLYRQFQDQKAARAEAASMEDLQQQLQGIVTPLVNSPDNNDPNKKAILDYALSAAQSRNPEFLKSAIVNINNLNEKNLIARNPTDKLKDVRALHEMDPSIDMAKTYKDYMLKPSTQINMGTSKPFEHTEAGYVYDPMTDQPVDIPVNVPKDQFLSQNPGLVYRKPPPEMEKLKDVPPTHKMVYAENAATIKKLEDTLKTVEKYPEAFGPHNIVNNMPGGKYVLPKLENVMGVDDKTQKLYDMARTKVGDVGSYKRHDLSGTAVTPSEDRKTVWSVVDPTDNPSQIKNKLSMMIQDLKGVNSQVETMYAPGSGYRPMSPINPYDLPTRTNAQGQIEVQDSATGQWFVDPTSTPAATKKKVVRSGTEKSTGKRIYQYDDGTTGYEQ